MQLTKSKLKTVISPLFLEKRYYLFICLSLSMSFLKRYQT